RICFRYRPEGRTVQLLRRLHRVGNVEGIIDRIAKSHSNGEVRFCPLAFGIFGVFSQSPMSRRRQQVSTISPLIWLVVVILILYFARAVLIPLALALALNFLLTPMVMWLLRLRVPRVLAVAIVMLVSAAVVGGMGWIVADQLLQVASNLPEYRLNIHDKIEALHLPPDSA